MAFVVPGAGSVVKMRLRFSDSKTPAGVVHRSVTLPFDTDLDTTIANGITAANTWAGASRCEVSVATFKIVAEDAAATPAEAGSSVYEQGNVGAELSQPIVGENTNGGFSIPDPVAACRLGGDIEQRVLDTTHALITAIRDLYVAGTGIATISEGQNIVSLKQGKVIPSKGKPKFS